MPAPMKKRPIENGRLLVVACPQESVASVMDFLKSSGCDVNDATPDPDTEDAPLAVVAQSRTPGTILRGLRYRENLTQAEFARRVGISRRHISEMENDRRPIGKTSAMRISEKFAVDPRVFLWAGALV